MAENLDVRTMYKYIVGDFECAWNALCKEKGDINRGNFLFGFLAMIFLEWISRLCQSDKCVLKEFSDALDEVNAVYGTKIPGITGFSVKDFELPSRDLMHEEHPLLWLIFDLIRNGQSHQYQQILVKLNDGKNLVIQLVGAEYECFLNDNRSYAENKSIFFRVENNGDVIVRVHPDWLFLDLKKAVKNINLLDRGLTFEYLERPKPRLYKSNGSQSRVTPYNFTSANLIDDLRRGGIQYF